MDGYVYEVVRCDVCEQVCAFKINTYENKDQQRHKQKPKISSNSGKICERQRSTMLSTRAEKVIAHFCGIGNCQKYASYAMLISISELFQVFYCLVIRWYSDEQQKNERILFVQIVCICMCSSCYR